MRVSFRSGMGGRWVWLLGDCLFWGLVVGFGGWVRCLVVVG